MKRLLITLLVLGGFAPAAWSHAVGEVAGLRIVFGANPEPALTDERLGLEWIVSAADAEQGAPMVSGLIENPSMTIVVDGETYGPFVPEEGYGEPGIYATYHIFPSAGEFPATLTFTRPGIEGEQSITLDMHITDRNELIIGK